MSDDPLSLTFDTLAGSNRPDADDLLIAALDVPYPKPRDLAAAAISRRGSVRGLVELLRRFCDLSDAARAQFAEPSEPLSRAFKQSLRHGDEPLILQALLAVQFGARVEQMPLVAELLKSESDRIRGRASTTLSMLADRLYDLLRQPTGGSRGGRIEVGRIRDETLDALASACERLDRVPDPIGVLEQLFSLATPNHPAVTKVMRQSLPEWRRFAEDVLARSRHPGVMRMLLEFFSESYPPKKVFETMRTRDDPEFIAALLRWFPEQPTNVQIANFRQIDSVPWLDRPEQILDIPESLQGKLPAFILATGLPEARKMELQEWVVRNGSAEGRRSATQVFDRLDFETTRRILLDSLDSTDEDVSAWATTQLRPRHVPGAFRMLIDRLDSPSEVIRQAARDELKGFTIEHLVAIQDRLGPSLCQRAGQLVRKVDPDALAKLAAMIAGPMQRQRIAAVQAVGRLGMIADLRHVLLGLLSDRDTVIRRIAVETLAEDRSPEVLDAMRELVSDPSPRVRQAAERALAAAGLSAEIPASSSV